MRTVWSEGCWRPRSLETGTRETEVRLDGWCEGGLRQQRNGGGCATMRERSERVKSPGTHVTEWVSRGHFCLALLFRTALPCSGSYHMEREGCRFMMRLGQTIIRAQLLKIKAHMSVMWAKGCILMTVCVFYLTWHDYPSLVEGESHGILYNSRFA